VTGAETTEPITASTLSAAALSLQKAEKLQGGWKLLKDTKMNTIYKNKTGTAKKYMFVVKEAAAKGIPLRFPAAMLSDDEFFKKANADLIVDFKVLPEPNAGGNELYYQAMKSPGPVGNRDTVHSWPRGGRSCCSRRKWPMAETSP
jgi:hypothetical protein